MKFLAAVLSLAFIFSAVAPAGAQEPELISEIVARVNNEIITRADYLNALSDFRAELARQLQQQGKGEAEINAEFERLKPTVLDVLIEDLLLEQKAKELGMDVEADVNQQMAEYAKEQGFKDVLAFEAALKQQGMDPEIARSTLRKRLQQTYVVQREVMQPIYNNLRDADRKAFYEKYKDKFTTEGEVTISEIFLPLEGYTAADVEQRARRVVAELRAGMSFTEAVEKNSPANRASRANKGKLGTFKPGEIKEDLSKAISTLKVGEVTEPIRIQEGYQIIRVDDRKPSMVRPFEDPEVQQIINRAATMERAEEGRKKYIARLRKEAYIQVAPGYPTSQAKN